MLRARTLLGLGAAERAVLALGCSALRRIGRLLRKRGNSDCQNCSNERGSGKTVGSGHTVPPDVGLHPESYGLARFALSSPTSRNNIPPIGIQVNLRMSTDSP